jgi:Phospholipase_D-nuclease N-terminal
MILATDYPLLEVFWTILIFVGFAVWIYLLFVVFADIFRRHDESGWVKVLWIVFVIVTPYLGVFIYLLVENDGMDKRAQQR